MTTRATYVHILNEKHKAIDTNIFLDHLSCFF